MMSENDDLLDLDGGDLGLGKGLKPGALPPLYTLKLSHNIADNDSTKNRSDDRIPDRSMSASHNENANEYQTHSQTWQCSANYNPESENEQDLPNTDEQQCKYCHSPLTTSSNSMSSSPSKSVVDTIHKVFGSQPDTITKNGKANDFGQRALMKLSQVSEKIKLLRKTKSDGQMHFDPLDFDDNSDTKDMKIGTSFSQQKSLFQRDVHQILHVNASGDKTKSNKQSTKNTSQEPKLWKDDEIDAIQCSLQQAQEEVKLLKQQLELCHRQLEGKYQAIEILQLQSNSLQDEQQDNQQKTKQMNKNYQKEISELQFELEYRESSSMYSQQTWAERFDRASQENLKLLAQIQSNTQETRKLHAEKLTVTRERDELLALLDVQERQQYDSSRSSQDDHQAFTSAEMAVLGACNCRGRNPEPCSCACAAAHLKRDIVKAKEELEQCQKKYHEASVTGDAYRIAFEEELARNRTLIRKLADLSSTLASNSKTSKARAAVRWLIKQLNEEEETMARMKLQHHLNEDCPDVTVNETFMDTQLEEKTDEELIHMLVDMVSDKSEALAHQRLAARMLASKTRELERRLLDTADKTHI